MILVNYIRFESANEMIRDINTIQEEKNYIVMTFSGKDDLIDISIRVNIPRILKTIIAIKYYYGLNIYRERYRIINLNKTTTDYLRYSAIET